jgi:NhaP-type Na+/H+ or K+/H+ antiporter
VKNVPLNLRRILSAESAANDGLAYPFLTISLYLTLETSRRVAVEKWLLIGILCTFAFSFFLPCQHAHFHADQVVLGTVLGAVLGKC